ATVNSGSRVQIPIPPPPLESPLRNQRAFFRLEFGKRTFEHFKAADYPLVKHWYLGVKALKSRA
ncbi:hypothetical protein AB6E79_07635, partial [Vibrio lentus]